MAHLRDGSGSRATIGLVLAAILLGGWAWVALRNRTINPTVNTIAIGTSPVAILPVGQKGHALILTAAPGNPPTTMVSAVNVETGLLQHGATIRLPQVLAADVVHGRVFVVGVDNTVRVLDGHTGMALDKTHLPTAINMPGVVEDANIARVFVLDNTNVRILDARRGHVLQDVPLGMDAQGIAIDMRLHRVVVTGYRDTSPVGVVRILDAASGRVLHVIALDQSPSPGSIVIDQKTDHAFIADRTINTVDMLDLRSGHLLRTLNLNMAPETLVVDSHRAHLFIGGNDAKGGKVEMVETRSGQLVQTMRVTGTLTALVADEQAGRICALMTIPRTSASGNAGRLVVFDSLEGRSLHTITLDMSPRIVALDERTGRVIVGGDVVSDSDEVSKRDLGGRLAIWVRRIPLLGTLWSEQQPPNRFGTPISITGRISVVDAMG